MRRGKLYRLQFRLLVSSQNFTWRRRMIWRMLIRWEKECISASKVSSRLQSTRTTKLWAGFSWSKLSGLQSCLTNQMTKIWCSIWRTYWMRGDPVQTTGLYLMNTRDNTWHWLCLIFPSSTWIRLLSTFTNRFTKISSILNFLQKNQWKAPKYNLLKSSQSSWSTHLNSRAWKTRKQTY